MNGDYIVSPKHTDPIRLGTRGSALALTQAELVKEQLEAHRYTVDIVEVTTTGDEIQDELISRLGKTGAFVRELDERVLSGDLDAAVHSLKDMPTEMPPDLIVAAIPERERVGDALLTPGGRSLAELPDGAVVGTGSLRRQAQLQRLRSDLSVVPIRGNIDTRIVKLLAPTVQQQAAEVAADEREEWEQSLGDIEQRALHREFSTAYDAIVLAHAGLERTGLHKAIHVASLPKEKVVPAAGQGAIAVTMRDGDLAHQVHQQIDHPPSRVAVTVERTILAGLNGGCIAPIGVHAVVQADIVRTNVAVLSSDGDEQIAVKREIPVEAHVEGAQEVATELVEMGADELIAAAKRDPGAGRL